MTQWHMRSKTKPSGGKRNASRRCKKKKAWRGGDFAATKVAHSNEKEKRKVVRVRGGNIKIKQQIARYANVAVSGKVEKMEIVDVLENKANRHYARRDIITKGAIILVKKGDKELKAEVTSRPGQDGVVNAKTITD
ncbi:MAG: 30S ribosomal protein S8e [Candidatus Diapherotrites archaeon]|nr:30S ribosomal protein S8e [Candidatus Diapherotrites archaeon]